MKALLAILLASAAVPTSAEAAGALAHPAAYFLASIGVNIGPGRVASQSQYITMLNYIGARIVRGSNVNGNFASWVIPIAKATNTHWIYGLESGPVETTASLTNVEAAQAKQLASAGVLLALEGANETDNWCVTYNGVAGGGQEGPNCGPWHGAVDYLQRDWYAAVKADPVLKNYPVYSSTHVGGEPENDGLQFIKIPAGAGTLMPDGTTYADYANSHNYVIWNGASAMTDNIAWCMASSTAQDCPSPQGSVGYMFYADFERTWWSPGFNGYTAAQAVVLPKVTTETGWESDQGGEDNQGKVLMNVYLSQYKRGFSRTFIYQLRDNEGGFTNTFGFFNQDFSPKKSATYLHNLTTILNDNAAITPGSLNYSIPSEPATVHDLLLQKSTGNTFEVVVWDERPIGEAVDNVTVNLGGTHQTVNVYDPTVGTSKVQVLSNVSSVPLTMYDHPMIVEVIN